MASPCVRLMESAFVGLTRSSSSSKWACVAFFFVLMMGPHHAGVVFINDYREASQPFSRPWAKVASRSSRLQAARGGPTQDVQPAR